jgi:hypothetical protein
MLCGGCVKFALRCGDGPPAFAGAESGFAGVTINLACCVFRHTLVWLTDDYFGLIPAAARAGLQVALKSSAPLWLCAQIAKYR